ncbi:TIGR01777 family oxidoreductase [Akkermansiaceae bacterium]|nr:TIGR01777 family oxidoreductase [Akkermansiaceae bacterium]
MKKVIVIAGVSGFLGKNLALFMLGKGWQVRGVSRQEKLDFAHDELILYQWDGETEGEWMKAFEGADVVVNLAGRTVNCRYHQKNKHQVMFSRVRTTELIASAIDKASEQGRAPELWVNSSTATIYRHAEDKAQTDESGEIGEGFSIEVAKAWEAAFFESQAKIRKVAMRTAIVLGSDKGSAFDVLYHLSKRYLGGTMGSGKQMVSWLHIEDFCRGVLHFIEHQNCEGVYNLSAPNPVTNKAFMQQIRRVSQTSFGLPATEWMLELGAFFMRTETELILKSRWVLPTRLQSEGFEFKFDQIETCLDEITAQSKKL